MRELVGSWANVVLKYLDVEARSLRRNESKGLWESDSEFVELMHRIKSRTLLSRERAYALWQLARIYRHVPPDVAVAEIGAYKGGSSYILASACPEREVHVFDTFTGLPEPDDNRLPIGAFGDISATEVRNYLSVCSNVVLHEGRFPLTAKPIANRMFCIVHVDVDLYSSTRDALEFFDHRIVPGGVIVVDDYATKHVGVTRAVDEFSASTGRVPLVLAKGQCVIIAHQKSLN